MVIFPVSSPSTSLPATRPQMFHFLPTSLCLLCTFISSIMDLGLWPSSSACLPLLMSPWSALDVVVTFWASGNKCICAHLVAQSCPVLCDPMDCSLPGFSVHEILQARILEWVAVAFLQGIFPTQELNLCLLCWQVDSLPTAPPGKPQLNIYLHPNCIKDI